MTDTTAENTGCTGSSIVLPTCTHTQTRFQL